MAKEDQSQNSFVGKWPDPISFLKDYMDFAINARLRVIRMLNEAYKASEDIHDQQMLYLLSFEQFIFTIEALFAFLNVAIHESPVDLGRWILWFKGEKCGKKIRRYYSFGELYEEIKRINETQLREIYRAEFTSYKSAEVDSFVQSIMRIKKWLTKPGIKETIEPFNNVFNRLKHKFLAYRFKDDVVLLLSSDIEKKFQKLGKNHDGKLGKNLDVMVTRVNEVNEHINTIIMIVIMRLDKEGANRWLSGPGKDAPLFTLHHPQSP